MQPTADSPGILRLGFPLVISFAVRAAFTLVDRFYAAELDLADASQAAIGLTVPFDFLIIACWVGASNGLTTRLSAAMGAGQNGKVEQLKRASYSIIIALCVLFLGIAAAIWAFADRFISDADAAEQFRVYASVLIAGSAITSFWSILPDSLVKAHQDMKSTMWAGLWSGFTNVILNTLFVFVFHWGIFGIAVSTIIGRIAGLIYAQRRADFHERRRLAETSESEDPELFDRPLWAILSLGLPASVTFIVPSLESLGVNALFMRHPDPVPALAAWSVFDSIGRFLCMPPIAIGVALLPLTARLWGAGDYQRIRHELRVTMRASLIYTVCFVVPLIYFGGDFLTRQLGDSEATRRFLALGMAWVPFAVLTTGPFFLVRSSFEGMQEPRPGFVVSILRSLLLSLPLVAGGMWLAADMGRPPIVGAYVGFGLASAIATAALVVWNRRWWTKQPETRG